MIFRPYVAPQDYSEDSNCASFPNENAVPDEQAIEHIKDELEKNGYTDITVQESAHSMQTEVVGRKTVMKAVDVPYVTNSKTGR